MVVKTETSFYLTCIFLPPLSLKSHLYIFLSTPNYLGSASLPNSCGYEEVSDVCLGCLVSFALEGVIYCFLPRDVGLIHSAFTIQFDNMSG